MITSLWKLVLIHVRIGYNNFLIAVDFVVAAIVAFDFYRFSQSSLAFSGVWSFVNDAISGQTVAWAITTGVISLCVLPIIVAAVVINTRQHAGLSSKFTDHGRLSILLHIAITLGVCLSIFILKSMQQLSGYSGTANGDSFSYESIFLEILRNGLPRSAAQVALAVITFIAGIYLKIILQGGSPPPYMVRYLNRALLADIQGYLRSAAINKNRVFNLGVAPEIRAIKQYADKLCRIYQAKIPGSWRAADYLQSLQEECRAIISQIILDDSQQRNWQIQFYPGTSRAMEVSLLNTKAPRNVILSPYEHPSEDAVGMWLDKVQGVSYRRARFRPDLFAQNWSKQLPQVVNELASLIDKDVPSNILLISEVFYATGHVIPINDLVSELRKQHPELQVIVDGAHSAGNLDFVRPPAYARAYICSGHKWLMSPEPCGIRLVIRSVDEGLRSYDAWNEELPVTTASIRMIASLRASLEVLQSLGMGALHRRSKLLKEFFLSKIDQTKFQIVGSGNGLSDTFMVALAPNPGFAWAMKGVASIQKNLTAHGIELSFVDLDDDLFWIRVTFPFFVHRTDVEILSSCLNPLVIREFQTSAKVQSE